MSDQIESTSQLRAITELLDIMKRLRDPVSGCPWDVQQTFSSIAPYTLEEAYEVADAIERQDMNDLKDELGDLLLQVVFHAQMALEQNAFSFYDVVEAICSKMIRRHPHVFSDEAVSNAEDVSEIWEREKQNERAAKKGVEKSILEDVPVALPGLTRAVKLQKRAAKVGFDWPTTNEVFDKLEEELDELRSELDAEEKNKVAIESELGDVLFVIANIARKLNVDPDAALRGANHKFRTRFRYIEEHMRQNQRPIEEASLDEMEELWQEAKVKS